jgi:hypothetical protein
VPAQHFRISIRRVPTVPSLAALGVGCIEAPTIASLNETTDFGAALRQRVSSEVTLYGQTREYTVSPNIAGVGRMPNFRTRCTTVLRPPI